MLPNLALANGIDVLFRYAVFGSKDGRGAFVRDNRENIRLGQFSLPVDGLAVDVAGLGNAVGLVVEGGAEKEMLRLDASRIVALVADHHPVRDGADEFHVRGAMCLEPPSTAKFDDPVSVFVETGIPDPTITSVNTAEEMTTVGTKLCYATRRLKLIETVDASFNHPAIPQLELLVR